MAHEHEKPGTPTKPTSSYYTHLGLFKSSRVRLIAEASSRPFRIQGVCICSVETDGFLRNASDRKFRCKKAR